MSWRIVRSRQARRDLDEIWLRLKGLDERAAERLLQEFDSALSLLSDYPRAGPARDDIVKGIRGFVRGYTLILYRLDDERKCVEIVRLIDGRRDLSALFLGAPD